MSTAPTDLELHCAAALWEYHFGRPPRKWLTYEKNDIRFHEVVQRWRDRLIAEPVELAEARVVLCAAGMQTDASAPPRYLQAGNTASPRIVED